MHSPITIREAVAAKLANSGEAVATSVIDSLADTEVKRREKLIIDGIAQLDRLEKDSRKIRPDQKALDGDGKVVAEHFSQAKYEELKKAKEGIERLTNAINKALNDRDFSKLAEMAQAFGKAPLTPEANAKPADG